jgi:hypothetical protein
MQKISYSIILLSLLIVFVACNPTRKIDRLLNSSNSIEVNKTTVTTAFDILGKNDDEFETIADGRDSNGRGVGRTSIWSTYKKYGIAIHTKFHYPNNDSLDGFVQHLRIFDTANISVRKSSQQMRYYGQDYWEINVQTLHDAFGNEEKIVKKNDINYYLYTNRHLFFALDSNNKFLRLYVIKSKS